MTTEIIYTPAERLEDLMRLLSCGYPNKQREQIKEKMRELFSSCIEKGEWSLQAEVEIEPFPEILVLADVPYAMNTPENWEHEYRDNWQALQVAEANKRELRAYARRLRAALAKNHKNTEEVKP